MGIRQSGKIKDRSLNPIPPFEKGGLGGFSQGRPKQIPLFSPFSKGDGFAAAYLRITSKKNTAAILILLFSLFLASSLCYARGGGGCLAGGTPVLTPQGPIPIEKLQVGDRVISVAADKPGFGRVLALMAIQAEEILEIAAAGAELRITPEHPVMIGPGVFLQAKSLKPGDEIYTLTGGRLTVTAIQSIRPLSESNPVYNLHVSPGGTFAAAGIIVHNKGCFLPDSPILKGDGTEAPISTIKPGDEVLAFTPEDRMVRTTVRNVMQRKVDSLVALQTARQILRVTAEHPFYVGGGLFKTLESLKIGDRIYAWDGPVFTLQPITGLETIRERTTVFNLQTDLPHTFFAGRLAVHNKGGGCFPAGTLIRTPQGPVPIETLSLGNLLLAVDAKRRTVRTEADELFLTRSRVLRIETDRGVLRTTTEHPLKKVEGPFATAGELKPGDGILSWVNNALLPAKVLSTSLEEQEQPVYNLRTAWPHTFIAGDFVVHNKGGGGFSRSSGSRSGGSSRSSSGSRSSNGTSDNEEIITVLIFIAVFAIPVIIFILRKGKRSKDENLDFVYSSAQIAPKAAKTEKLLNFLSRQDPSLSPQDLRRLAEATFRKLQECWQSRSYGPMESLLMPPLYAQHKSQLAGLRRSHEINRIENLKVDRLDLVNVRYTEKPDQREFTALITASARDYYVDDRHGKFLRGDSSPAQFQEFWTFQRWENRWLLREIEQAGESDLLKEENFVETLTDQTLRGIYGEAAEETGEPGPWLEKGAGEKAARIDRLLNFLVQTDKLWNRQQMLERARQVFLRVHLAEDSMDPAEAPISDLFPTPVSALQEQIRERQASGVTVEYRNLCVRKAELILVRNFSDRTKDEFTVRISAHAQRIIRKGDRVLSEQPYVTPFEEYWTFGRLDEQWKLKEVLPPARGKTLIADENIDEDSSPEQLQWYYRQTRAT